MIAVEYAVLKAHEAEYWAVFERTLKNGTTKCLIGDRWEAIKKDYPDVANLFPYTFKELVLGKFKTLLSVYDTYRSTYLPWFASYMIKHPVKAKKLQKAISESFDYTKRCTKIREFFSKYAKDLHILSCCYCDAMPINQWEASGNKMISQHVLDHALDWGDCPLVCYSLYNFVPSCTTCNTLIKQMFLIGGQYDANKVLQLPLRINLMNKVTPCSPDYDFDNNVEINIEPANAGHEKYVKNADKYNIEFDTSKDPDYEEDITFFQLRDRYNDPLVKGVALGLMDLIARHPLRLRKAAAKRHHQTLQEYEDELFQAAHYRTQYTKLYKDLLK